MRHAITPLPALILALALAQVFAAPAAADVPPAVDLEALLSRGEGLPALVATIETALGVRFAEAEFQPDGVRLRGERTASGTSWKCEILVGRIADGRRALAPFILDKAETPTRDDRNFAVTERFTDRFALRYRIQVAPLEAEAGRPQFTRRDSYRLTFPPAPGGASGGVGLHLFATTEIRQAGCFPPENNPLERILPFLLDPAVHRAFRRDMYGEREPAADPRLDPFMVRGSFRPAAGPRDPDWGANVIRFALENRAGEWTVGNVEEAFLGGGTEEVAAVRLAARLARLGFAVRSTAEMRFADRPATLFRYEAGERIGFAAAQRIRAGRLPFYFELSLARTAEAALAGTLGYVRGRLSVRP